MQDFVQTDYPILLWLTQAQYDALPEHFSYGLYFIKDANRIYRGSRKLLDPFEIVNSFPEPYDGDIRAHTICVRTSFDDNGRTTLEARVLNDDLTWSTLVPPILSVVDKGSPTDGIPTEGAIVTYVGGEIATLKDYVDDVYARMLVALEAAVDAQSDAEAAAARATAGAEMAVDNGELAQSFAVGGTGARPNENTDNALYYKNEAKRLVNLFTAVHTIKPGESHNELEECVNVHVPDYNSEYTLPEVTDLSVAHKCTLEVLFTKASLTCAILNHDGQTLTPLTTPAISNGSAVRYTCTYSNVLSEWVVEALLLNP